MKRSEMLKLIRAELLGKKISDNFEEEILNTVEKLGMLPPTIISMPYQYNRTEGTYGFEVNQWEPEDEQK